MGKKKPQRPNPQIKCQIHDLAAEIQIFHDISEQLETAEPIV